MNTLLMMKNTASQKVPVYAYNNGDYTDPVTGGSATITAQISIDGAACGSTNDTNPTELDSSNAPGIYIFDMTTAEMNGDMLIVYPESSMGNTDLDPVIITTQTTIAHSENNYSGIMKAIKGYDHTLLYEDPDSFYTDVTTKNSDISDMIEEISIRKNVACNNFPFIMFSSTDGKTPKTGLTVAVERSLDGGAFASADNTPATEIGSGAYEIDLTATDLNADVAIYKMAAAGALTRFVSVFTNDY